MLKTLFVMAFGWTATALAQTAPQQVDKVPTQREAKAERSAAAGGTVVRERRDPAEAQRLFRELDRNGDGYLTQAELWSGRGDGANWAASDRNGDGRIAPDEFTVLRR